MTNTEAATPTEGKLSLVLHVDVLLAAREQGRGTAAQTWDVLRSLDPRGQGIVPHDVALAGLRRVLAVSEGRAYARLAESRDGAFWERIVRRDGSRAYRLVGLVDVVRALGLARIGRAVRVDAADYASVAGRNAAALRAWLARRVGPDGLTAPMAQATIAARTGVSPRTQRRHRGRGIAATQNVAVLPYALAGEAVWRPGQYVDRNGRSCQVLPNSYATDGAELCGRTGTRRTNHVLATTRAGQRGATPRTYCLTPAQSSKAGGHDHFLFKARLPGGRGQVWELRSPAWELATEDARRGKFRR